MSTPMNVALNRPTTTSSFVKPYEPARAVNGTIDSTSRWLCNTLPGWLCVDLGAPIAINRWVVKHMTMANWKSPDYNMCDYMLQGSTDGKNWGTIDMTSNNTLNITDRTFTAVTLRYVRLYVTKGIRTNPQLASCMELEIYQAPTNPNLSALSISNGTLTPVFASNVYTYSATVDSDNSSITLTPTAIDPVNTTITVNNTIVKSSTASQPIPLNPGVNAITIKGSGAIGNTLSTYTVNVTRLKSAYLSNLTLSSGGLNPAFSKGQFSYTSSVGYDTASITVTPSAEDPQASIKVNGSVVASGAPSQAIALNVGANNVTVEVTPAGGGAAKTYTVAVTRLSSAYLQNLTLSSGTLNPSFGRAIFSYSTTVADAAITVTPTAEDGNAQITVNGQPVTSGQPSQSIPLNVGSNTITIIVNGAQGGTNTYILNVTRTENLYLTRVDLSYSGKGYSGSGSVSMDHTNLNYTTNTVIKATQVVVTPYAEDITVIINVNGQSITSGNSTTAIPLSSATNQITIKVSKVGVPSSRDYILTITKS